MFNIKYNLYIITNIKLFWSGFFSTYESYQLYFITCEKRELDWLLTEIYARGKYTFSLLSYWQSCSQTWRI